LKFGIKVQKLWNLNVLNQRLFVFYHDSVKEYEILNNKYEFLTLIFQRIGKEINIDENQQFYIRY
jgi:hypothetical protein